MSDEAVALWVLFGTFSGWLFGAASGYLIYRAQNPDGHRQADAPRRKRKRRRTNYTTTTWKTVAPLVRGEIPEHSTDADIEAACSVAQDAAYEALVKHFSIKGSDVTLKGGPPDLKVVDDA